MAQFNSRSYLQGYDAALQTVLDELGDLWRAEDADMSPLHALSLVRARVKSIKRDNAATLHRVTAEEAEAAGQVRRLSARPNYSGRDESIFGQPGGGRTEGQR